MSQPGIQNQDIFAPLISIISTQVIELYNMIYIMISDFLLILFY